MGLVTELINELETFDGDKTGKLFSLVYHELRSIAQQKMASESPGQTLQPTALVNEAYLKIINSNGIQVQDRGHFLRLASRAMQRILVARARARRRLKRGGDSARQPLSDAHLVDSSGDTDLLDLNDSLEVLEESYPERAELVRLHVFSGLTLGQCAITLNTSKSTVERHWRFARAWLLHRMSGNKQAAPLACVSNVQTSNSQSS